MPEYQDVTADYFCMIQSFAADFELVTESEKQFSELDKALCNKNPHFLEDIDNLSRLAFYLRRGKIKIIKQND